MRPEELSIRRPVLTIVFSLLILLAGFVAMTQLGVREYPAVDPPTISVSTSYPGAAAEVVQAQITEPLEEAINAVAGIRTLTSTSREGVSQISAEFSLDTDIDVAASDVRDQLARAIRNLPVDANPPVLNKAHADSAPIFGIALSSEKRTQLELGAYADALRERLQTVPGIAGVEQPAEKRYAMRLWMDPEKLAAYSLTPLDVRQALARENIELPSGRIEGQDVELPVKTLSRLNMPHEFDAVVIKRTGDSIVRFRDIGYAELGALNERGALKLGDSPVAGLYFKQQPGANQIEIVNELRRRLDQVRHELPPDIQLEIAYDNTEFVRRSLLEVTETIFVAFALVVLVVFLFLREWRTTLIPVLAIPISIVGGFAVMAVADFSINTLTLLGIVLAVGLVVDDAIVVLENIYAKIERGMPPVTAAIVGTKEIFMAVVTTTLTLGAVFLPLLFMSGMSGRLFREFGMTISGAVVISALVALTLTPMMCSRLLRSQRQHSRLFRLTEPYFRALESAYASALSRSIERRGWALIALAVTTVVGYLLFSALPRELAPMEDRGRLWVRALAPEGVGYEYMQHFMDEVAREVAIRVPEAHYMMTQVPAGSGGSGVPGPMNNGFVRLFLKDKGERERSQAEIVADLQTLGAQFSVARINIQQETSIGERRASQSGIQFVVQTGELSALEEKLPVFLEEARKLDIFTYVDSDLKFTKPEVRVSIDRDKALSLGVSTLDIAQTLQSSLSGQRFGYFLYNGKQYEVVGQFTRDFRSRPGDLSNISVRTTNGESMVRLDNLVTIEESSAPPALYRFNRYAAATVSATLASGRTTGEGIAALEDVAGKTLDERFTTDLAGTAKELVESSSSLGQVFLLAIALIYLMLAAQFESFVDPLIILLTVPLALAGGMFALWYFDQSLNLFSQIGLIMLIGLITKNGILIVEFANQRVAAGLPLIAATREAAGARLRPILMTTLAMMLGILPIALALGAGAESRMSMGIVVIGGLIFGSALTLFVIPSMYVMLKRAPRAQPASEPQVSGAALAD